MSKPVVHPEVRVPVSALKEFEGNTNRHPERNRQAIKASLQEFTQLDALLVWGKNTITGETMDRVLGGNGRLVVIRDELAWPDVNVKRVDCSPKQARAINIALNRTGRLSERDDAAEAEALKELRDEPLLLEAAGYHDDELQELLDELEDEVAEADDLQEPSTPPVPTEPKTKPGDVWILGRHRLLCGDSTDRETVRRAFGGAGPDAIIADPPYGIGFVEGSKGLRTGGKRFKGIAGDDSDPLVLTQKAIEASGLAPDSPLYVCCDWRSLSSMRAAVKNAGHQEKAVIVWDKTRAAKRFDRYFKQHEFILYAGPYGGETCLRGDVWSVSRAVTGGHEHPTQKPVELMGMAVRDSTQRGGLVYDPFGGSGSTLLACEQLGRRCVTVELDPAYCDVIVARFEELTGKTATREAAS